MMRLIEPAGTPEEPLTLADFKRWLAIDADFNDEDTDIALLITAERQRMEKHLNIALVPRVGLTYIVDPCYCQNLRLPFSEQVTTITSVLDSANIDIQYEKSGTRYKLYGNGKAVSVLYTVAAKTDAALLQCLKQLVATSFKYREDLSNDNVYKLHDAALDKVESFSNNLPL